MLTVPGQALCSCEHEIVTGGSCRSGYAAASSAEIVVAITESVMRGR